MIASEAIEAFKQGSGENSLTLGVAGTAASIFGISVSTYDYTPRSKEWRTMKEEDSKNYEISISDLNKNLDKKLGELRLTSKFIEAPETGKDSNTEMIEKIRKRESNRALSKLKKGDKQWD